MKSSMSSCVWALMLLSVASGAVPSPTAREGVFKLRLLHSNDMHARFQQVSRSAGKCTASDAKENLCYGGFARMRTALSEEFANAKKENFTPLSLNAGDSYQGTVWYTIFKWKVVLFFMELLNIDVMSLGNHEFDDGIEGVVPFLKDVTIPVVTCNIDDSGEPEFAKVPLKRSIILNRGGWKIGIMGYLTPQTAILSNTRKLKFKEEIASLTREVEKLKNEGVKIIIALGHSGLDVDMKIAEMVPDVDVVVGGHSHTFLYTGPAMDSEIPVDSYPVMVTQPSGRKVPVVQAYAFTKYLGKLDLIFDEKGEVVEATGNPILLDYKIKEDEEVLDLMEDWENRLNQTLKENLGKSNVFLDAMRCRFEECNLGNLITDAYIHHAAKTHSGPHWTEAAIALQQGGGIRATINATGNKGWITREDVITSMPFYSTLSVAKMKGKILWEAFEWSVARYEHRFNVGRGEFLQVSGAKVQFDLAQEVGSRVVSVSVKCASCDVPVYEPLEMEEEYQVIMPTFLLRGGDNFTMFSESADEIKVLGMPDTEIVINYIKSMEVVYTGLEDRLEFVKKQISSSGIALKFNYFIYLIFFSCLFVLK